MRKRLLLIVLCGARALFGWGCEGHQVVALIAEKNLDPRAKEQVQALLSNNPVDPHLIRYCVQGRDDLMADAATWADDIRRTDATGKWHYIDIPRQSTSGDPQQWCEPVGPPAAAGEHGHSERNGCVLTAIAYNRGILQNPQAPAADRARALRYLIHFVGDVHQPLHATDNHDQGGNCAPMVLLNGTTISNLHSIWDSGLLEEHLHELNESPAQYAAALNTKYASARAGWAPAHADVENWIWESHSLANQNVYGALQPQIPIEPTTARTDCNAESEKVYALHIHLDREYLNQAAPIIDQQLARAGFRLAALLNEIWP